MQSDYRPAPERSHILQPIKFIAKIHTVVSLALLLSFSGIIIAYSLLPPPKDSDAGETLNFRKGVLMFMIIGIVGSSLDLILAIFLFYGAKKINIELIVFWWRSTLSSLAVFLLLTPGFCVLVDSALPVLAVVPNAIFKPFALYVVARLLGDSAILQLRRPAMLDKRIIPEIHQPGSSSHDGPPPVASEEGDVGKLLPMEIEQASESADIGLGDARRATLRQQKIKFLSSTLRHTGLAEA